MLETLGMGQAGFLIKLGFEFLNCGEIGWFAAEEFDDFDGRAEVGKRIDFEDVQRFDAVDPAVGIFFQKGIQNGAGIVAIFGENIALLHVVGTFAAGKRRLVEGDMADEIEGVVVAAHLLGEFVKKYAAIGEFLYDRLLAFGVVPRVRNASREA